MFRRAKRVHLLVRLKLHPITDPTGQPMPNNRGRKGSVFYRLHEMASGRTIRRLEENGFRDADVKHQPTFPASEPFAQLDHPLVSKHFEVVRFERLAAGSSDHRGIVVEIEV
jgi:endonuclease/exonuclease/phosphatase family metal-dependent hydrolase